MSVEPDLIIAQKHWASRIVAVIELADTSDFSVDEIRCLPNIQSIEDWDLKIPVTEPVMMSVGINKEKDFCIFDGTKWRNKIKDTL